MEKRLGKGLDALISSDAKGAKDRVEKIKLSDIVPNPFQPRKKFSQEKLDELISSLKEKGIIQPILVRAKESGYELIAGERRLRAAKEAGMEEIPAIVRADMQDVDSLELSLVENIQREELNPIEEASAYRDLTDKFEYTLEKIGQMVSKDKTTISNSLRLLALSEEIKGYVEDEKISAGHAKALLGVTSEHKRKRIAELIINKGLSVRQAENIISSLGETRKNTRAEKAPEITRIEEELRHKLGTKVNIHHGKKRGRIEIQYYSDKDLQRLLDIML